MTEFTWSTKSNTFALLTLAEPLRERKKDPFFKIRCDPLTEMALHQPTAASTGGSAVFYPLGWVKVAVGIPGGPDTLGFPRTKYLFADFSKRLQKGSVHIRISLLSFIHLFSCLFIPRLVILLL